MRDFPAFFGVAAATVAAQRVERAKTWVSRQRRPGRGEGPPGHGGSRGGGARSATPSRYEFFDIVDPPPDVKLRDKLTPAEAAELEHLMLREPLPAHLCLNPDVMVSLLARGFVVFLRAHWHVDWDNIPLDSGP